MNSAMRIESIKKTHDQLYHEVLTNHKDLLQDADKLNAFVQEKIDPLLADIEDAATSVSSQTEYNWLKDTAMKWQIVLSSVLNIPRTVRISPPQQSLEPPTTPRILTPAELQNWIDKRAFDFSRTRRMNQIFRDPHLIDKLIDAQRSSDQERDLDWQNAHIDFAYQVLSGGIDFTRELRAESYDFLERIWLRDIKRLRAYFLWEDRGSPWDPEHGSIDYYQACRQIRELLVNDRFKCPSTQFEEARTYLETQYLTEGRIAWGQERANRLLKSKLRGATNITDGREWEEHTRLCKNYIQLFYENIIPAVIRADAESIWTVLKAFQIGSAPESRYPVVNSFEVALAVYFLDRNEILDIWQNSEPGLYP